MTTVCRIGRRGLFCAAAALAANTLGLGLASMPAQAASDPLPAPAEPAAQRPLNVLVIISDDMNTRLGTYGGPAITPNIDRLAREGVRFDSAYVQFPWCGPSRASFLTGLRPNSVGVTDLRTHVREHVPDIVTLPQYFRNAGYFSGRVGKVFHQSVPGGIGKPGPDDPQSWDQALDPRGRDKDVIEANGLIKNLTPGVGYGSAMSYYADEGPESEQTDAKVATRTIEMIRTNKDKPFFIAAGFYRPHHPEIAPAKYFEMYPLDRVKPAGETRKSMAGVLPVAKAWLPDNMGMTEAQQREMIRSYYAATSFVDAQVGRILDAVREMGLDDDTIVVFMSDHGYLLGEHGQWMKNSLWEQAARAPLIIRVPGMKGNGAASPRIVEFLDIYPTLVEAAGLGANTRNQGKSLLPLLRDPDAVDWTKPAYSQVRGGRSVRTARWRYTEWEGGAKGRQLFDELADPRERRNLANEPRYASIVAQMRALLPDEKIEDHVHQIRYRPGEQCMELPRGVPAAVGRACEGVEAPGDAE